MIYLSTGKMTALTYMRRDTICGITNIPMHCFAVADAFKASPTYLLLFFLTDYFHPNTFHCRFGKMVSMNLEVDLVY